MRQYTTIILAGCVWATTCALVNFDYEKIQLTETVANSFPALCFGDTSDGTVASRRPRCKIHPDDDAWPSDGEWQAFNKSLDGVLLKPTPPGAACYPRHPGYNAESCTFLTEQASSTRFWINDPLTVLLQWAQGNTCRVEVDPVGRCTQGGYPAYVVNATSVKHVQMAVNFARNKNIRLVIKNTGHDFSGKSTGYGSLSIWLHHIKELKLEKEYTMGEYHGTAAKISAGTEGWETLNLMNASDPAITFVAPGAGTLAHAGGWSQGGGHSTISGYYGLGADQILSLNVVTADGRFVTANVHENSDLFYALRGGGGASGIVNRNRYGIGTYGVVTSSVVKTYPGHAQMSGLLYSFTTGPIKANASIYPIFPTYPTVEVEDIEVFWKAFTEYLAFSKKSAAINGFAYGDLTPQGNHSFTFASMFAFPEKDPSQTHEFLQPLFGKFRDLGINITSPTAVSIPYARIGDGTGAVPGQAVFASRLLPGSLWEDRKRFKSTVSAIRNAVEDGGLVVRSRGYSPRISIAGYPTTEVSSGVNPALREALMHLTVFVSGNDTITAHSNAEQWLASHAKLDKYVGILRRLTPESGAYMNEADVLEPDWKRSFWGSKYPKLLEIKKARDPWGLFWAPRTVGSEEWEVVTEDKVPSQNGPLCRTH
ncbi:hypothetical protein jhhlp_005351 [Lomentospora prolificans]|uniref:FAD-binding PCMH-type domain-containing protein n=1 Tax=Lomentospora prolificans TaxID=41688 RepID=A0A2N3N7N4_9PEZI|nr:hypothetical protein jhhlp_005351 [Lomentospora prolificans]